MKKYIYIVAVLLTGIFSACDYNEHYFDDFENKTEPGNVATYEYTFQSGDVATIVSALRANKTAADSAMADAFNSAKVFSNALPASTLMPYLLKSKYLAGDVGSIAKITYSFDEKRDSVLTGLSTQSLVLGDTDYKLVWGEPFADAFTPSKSPANNLPAVLEARYPNAKKGDLKNITYQYSTEEPVDATVIGDSYLTEDFEGSYVAYDIINKDGWQSKDLKGTYNWQAKTYDSNFFAEVSSYKSTGENEIWLISPQVDLGQVANPYLSFDICVRNPAGDLLTVWVSKDFDGTNVAAATWTNISSKFTIPVPSASMNDFEDAGMGSLSSFAGEKVYVAFKYVGNGVTGLTTTYRVDNVNVFNAIPGIKVEKSETVYTAYEFDGSAWKASTGKVVLQPADYEAMGVTYLTTDNAPSYISTYLKSKYPYAQPDASYVVVYKTSSSNQADEYIFNNNAWTPNTFVVEKTDQFVFADVNGQKQWIFDPTFVVKTEKADYQIVVDYVKANEAVDNPAVWDTRGNAEYYYGFSAYYPNVSYRDKDRSLDPLYPLEGTSAEKEKFCNDRTIAGVQIILAATYPNATPIVNGVEQFAKVTLKIYSSHISTIGTEEWVYTMQCTGTKEWKFIQRESNTRAGYVETAE
ncbi:choice-of-anchor J domain-containing protein [Dysgonomonas macrotermitis]|uniref:DUF5017 domain-containing protein n=1 Tax=Dysgonomonas macrotermitis TaxID=1346286 RepID=A0A1M4T6R6_9BACT|nr:choice-of-anchor J domain-containing protein [Dysgonomonas macrotermitis]SHE40176.1 protein of unknown function [Dysgonomonas macrotermitis]